MSASIFFLVSLFLFLLFFHTSANSNPAFNSPSAHEKLSSYGFPVGLLPRDVVGYSLNETSGTFSVRLGGDCRILLPPDNYLAAYSNPVSGSIVTGRIADLDGIRVWAVFKWWSITGIQTSGDNLVFEIGMVKANYPAKNFEEFRECEGQRSAAS